jgi:NAD+ synthase
MNEPASVPRGQSAAACFGPHVLRIDAAAAAERIQAFVRTAIAGLHRRGAVVAVSGGVDSAVCAALACRALGPDRVRALWLPGANTPPDAAGRVRSLCTELGVALEEQSIVPALQALGCYRHRDAAIRRVFPAYASGDRYKIAIAGDLLARDRLNVFDLVVESQDGAQHRARLPLDAYLELTAATNMKQRARKLLEYHCAERHNFAVIGTPNRLEYEQGFFVRGGDGLADVKPIAHLYKTQVYALAEHLGVPDEIRAQPPSTDTYSLPQTQEEFFFALPWAQLDLLLWAHAHRVAPAEVAAAMALSAPQVERAFRDIEAKARAAARLHQPALRLETGPWARR